MVRLLSVLPIDIAGWPRRALTWPAAVVAAARRRHRSVESTPPECSHQLPEAPSGGGGFAAERDGCHAVPVPTHQRSTWPMAPTVTLAARFGAVRC